MKKIIISALVTFAFASVMAQQDMLIKTSKDTLYCQVKEIGTDEIKYLLPDYPSGVLFSIDKNLVREIQFSNGKQMTFTESFSDPENYADNRRNAVKLDFISPLTGNTTFGFERSLRPGRSIEAALGIIGLGVTDDYYNPAGVFVKFGYKFIKSPDFYLRGMRYAHLLKGGYVRPEIQLGYYSKYEHFYEELPSYPYGTEVKERVNVFTGTLGLMIGKQWIFDNIFLVDIHGGVGYGFDTNPHNWGDYHYGFVLPDEEVPIMFTGGLKVGVLFK
ncbi:MAG: hypothetical protein Kow00127_25200 [Bacteroidales bacterium]